MRKVKLGLILALSLVLVLLVVQNTSPVRGRFLWYSAEVPAILLLVLTAAGGFILGLLVALFYQRDKKPVPHSEYTERTYRG
ncbi:MAG: LapA family protein [Spirochaetaceae bacterium]|nr:MAG: LapA family protein [Spirochaetaceae bacterium]